MLALGAPAGWLALRAVEERRFTFQFLADEVERNSLLVIYLLVATLCVLGLAGYVVGSQADRLVEAARRDPLTGLHNSRFFHERLEQELSRAVRYSQPFAVLMADVDGLKQINDRHGHRVGSMALIKTARAIASEMRSSDIAARWGGDEFGVLAPNTNAAAARVLAERILESQALEGEAECPAVGLSIGVAAFEPDLAPPPTAQGLLQTADNALYDAKRAGRRRVSASIDLAAGAGTA